MLRNKWITPAGILTAGSTIMAYLAFSTDYFKFNDQGVVGVIFLGIVALWAFGISLINTAKYHRKVRYVDGFAHLAAGFSAIHALDRIAKPTKDQVMDGLINLCEETAKTFTVAKNRKCSVNIKVFTSGDDTKLKTIARDYESITDGRLYGDKEKVIYNVDDNTSFAKIIAKLQKGGKPYFFCNNLRWLRRFGGYKNSRMPGEKVRPWDLEYNSTIVLPILPFKTKAVDYSTLSSYGFLVIDSPKSSAFNEDIDIKILKGIADGLYNQIPKL